MMELLKKIWKFIYHPKGWFAILSVCLTVIFAAFSLVVVFTGNTVDVWAYPIYVMAAASLFCATFACIYHGKDIPKKLRSLAGRYAFTEKLWKNKEYRVKIVASLTLAVGLGYTLFLGVMAVLEASFWYASLAEYNAVFCITRFFVLNEGRRADKLDPAETQRKKLKAYAISGGLVCLVGVQFVFSVLGIVFRGETFRYAGIMIYVFALVTSIKVTMSIIKIKKMGKSPDFTVRAIVGYNLAGAAVSVVALQTAMFDSFGADSGINVTALNAVTGGVVCVFLLVLGALMLYSGIRAYKMLGDKNEK